MILFLVLSVVGFAVLGLAALLENTERGRRLSYSLLVRILGEPEPPPVYSCCVAARAGRSEAGYWYHRVRDHGDGAA